MPMFLSLLSLGCFAGAGATFFRYDGRYFELLITCASRIVGRCGDYQRHYSKREARASLCRSGERGRRSRTQRDQRPSD